MFQLVHRTLTKLTIRCGDEIQYLISEPSSCVYSWDVTVKCVHPGLRYESNIHGVLDRADKTRFLMENQETIRLENSCPALQYDSVTFECAESPVSFKVLFLSPTRSRKKNKNYFFLILINLIKFTWPFLF